MEKTELIEVIAKRLPFLIIFRMHAMGHFSIYAIEDLEEWIASGGKINEVPYFQQCFLELFKQISEYDELHHNFLRSLSREVIAVRSSAEKKAKKEVEDWLNYGGGTLEDYEDDKKKQQQWRKERKEKIKRRD
jgi:hypothetical protein